MLTFVFFTVLSPFDCLGLAGRFGATMGNASYGRIEIVAAESIRALKLLGSIKRKYQGIFTSSNW